MTQNELMYQKERLDKRLETIAQELKRNEQRFEDYAELSDLAVQLLTEAATTFRSSPDSHLFEGALEEGRYLERKTQASLEQSHEELLGEQRRLYQEEEALTRKLKLVKEKERANEY
ncbi:hypothetical protein AT50_00091 [Streptococcus equi subsp. zooepidemicus Sz105]|uniref:hypothetical protein n=1 Tax=Streptococcus equi TaxID=1336 RepID=UPI0005C2FC63|nr:hypothetical protein [Streptococcus equi]KIS12724.1 hypothetical protein AT50_00091 [Streptococcus equi subsp. zooepidemicus Sz105]MDI5988024.1 hypothetical protein [Streptococcus equi subsp. zooepidemicus]